MSNFSFIYSYFSSVVKKAIVRLKNNERNFCFSFTFSYSEAGCWLWLQMSTKLSMYEISCYILLCMIIEMTFFLRVINQFKNPKILCMCKFNTHFPPLAVLIKTFCFVCLVISGLVVCTGLYLLLKRNILLLKFNFK